MEYITIKESTEQRGNSEATIRKWCKEGTLTTSCNAEKKNGCWQIPANV